jgi:hypothetical protein
MIAFVYLMPTGVAGAVAAALASLGNRRHNVPASLKEETP